MVTGRAGAEGALTGGLLLAVQALGATRSVWLPACQQFFHAADNLRRRYLQRHRDSYHDSNCRAVDPALDETDVRPVKSSFQRQPFLRDLLAFPNLSKSLAKRLLWAGLRLNLPAPMIAGFLRQQINTATLPEDIPTEDILNFI
jgi:hypothetical protein